MAFNVPIDPSMYTVKPMNLSPIENELIARITLIEQMVNAEMDLWAHSPGCKTRDNITNAKVFLNTLRAVVEAGNRGLHMLFVLVVEVGSLKKLLTAFRAPKGASDEVKAATFKKRNEFKNGLIEIVRTIKNLFVSRSQEILDGGIDIQKLLDDQIVDLT